MSLIDDLKAAHEAASAQLPEADFHSAGWHRRNAASERRDTLMREHAGEIIAVLEDCGRMRAVVDAARAYRLRKEAEAATVGPWNAPEIDRGICATLNALEGKP